MLSLTIKSYVLNYKHRPAAYSIERSKAIRLALLSQSINLKIARDSVLIKGVKY
jgi:hypothetical protein